MAFDLQVSFMSKDGKIIEETANDHTIPVVFIKVKRDASKAPSPIENDGFVTLLAMIDTGADECYIDESIADELNLDFARKTEVSGATSVITSRKVYVSVSFPNVDGWADMEMSVTPMKQVGRKYHVIIGMNIIKLGCLIIDNINSIYRLSVGTPTDKKAE